MTKPIENTTLPGYWKDARGILTPENLIKPIDKERDQLVRAIVEQARAVSDQLTTFKQGAFADIQAFKELSAEEYGANVGGKKGNISLFTYDGKYRVQVAIQERITFDERLQAAKALIDECVTEWIEGSRPEIHAIVSQAFDTDKEGNINTGRVLALRRYEIADERWQRAMNAIGEAVQVVGSKSYIRVYERLGDSDDYSAIPLDVSGA
ncbi:DUF3164 family protein [Limnobaculum xujianqingii]|nr:DUF3164 family protein [Limnobaculum xujianqingii]